MVINVSGIQYVPQSVFLIVCLISFQRSDDNNKIILNLGKVGYLTELIKCVEVRLTDSTLHEHIFFIY